jgi:ankyrin repeat protein
MSNNMLKIISLTSVLSVFLSSCKSLSVNMIADEELIEELIEAQKDRSTTSKKLNIKNANDNPLENKKFKINELDALLIRTILEENNVSNSPNQALFWASKNQQNEVVMWLIAKGEADINKKDQDGWTPLHFAARYGYTSIAELLIKHGAQINIKAEDEFTPLHLAARYGYTSVAELLIQHGAQINIKAKDEFTPLHLAAEHNHVSVAELLISHGADLNAKDQHGQTYWYNFAPLHLAANNNHIAMAELLISHGANVNEKDKHVRTPLHWATGHKDTSLAALLIKYGADISEKDKYSRTPWHWAARQNNASFLKLLYSINSNNRSIRLCALKRLGAFKKFLNSELFDRNLIKVMLIYGDCNIDIKDSQGNTPLDIARQKGHKETVEILEAIINSYTRT